MGDPCLLNSYWSREPSGTFSLLGMLQWVDPPGLCSTDLTSKLFPRNMQKLLRNWPFMSPFSPVLAIPSRPFSSSTLHTFHPGISLWRRIDWHCGDLAPSISNSEPRPHLGRGRGCLFLPDLDCIFLYDGWFQTAIASINAQLLVLETLY